MARGSGLNYERGKKGWSHGGRGDKIQIDQVRKNISGLERLRADELHDVATREGLEQKYHFKRKGWMSVLEELRQSSTLFH